MKNKEKTEIVIPSGYSLDELLDLDGDLWDEKPIGVEEVRILPFLKRITGRLT